MEHGEIAQSFAWSCIKLKRNELGYEYAINVPADEIMKLLQNPRILFFNLLQDLNDDGFSEEKWIFTVFSYCNKEDQVRSHCHCYLCLFVDIVIEKYHATLHNGEKRINIFRVHEMTLQEKNCREYMIIMCYLTKRGFQFLEIINYT